MTTNPAENPAVPKWDLADRLNKALRHSNYGVTEIATALGVSRETVGRWINGRGKPKRAAVLAWASLTKVDLSWLEADDYQLPGLDSNQQHSDYPLSLVSRLADVIDLASRRAA